MNFDASVIHSLNTKLAVTQLETRTAVRRHCTASYVLVTSRHPTPKTSKQTNKQNTNRNSDTGGIKNSFSRCQVITHNFVESFILLIFIYYSATEITNSYYILSSLRSHTKIRRWTFSLYSTRNLNTRTGDNNCIEVKWFNYHIMIFILFLHFRFIFYTKLERFSKNCIIWSVI